jgi:hypothetical protein
MIRFFNFSIIIFSYFLTTLFINCTPAPKTRTVGPEVKNTQDANNDASGPSANNEQPPLNTGETGNTINQTALSPSVNAFVKWNTAGQFKNCLFYKSGNESPQKLLGCNKLPEANTCVAPSPQISDSGVLLSGFDTLSKVKVSLQFQNYKHISSETCVISSKGEAQYKYAAEPTSSIFVNIASVDLSKQIKCGKKTLQKNGKTYHRWKVCLEDNPQFDNQYNDFVVVFETENPEFEVDSAVGCDSAELMELADGVCK